MDKAYNVYWSQTALDELSIKHKRENVYIIGDRSDLERNEKILGKEVHGHS